jgi:hypothetical protein
MNGNHFKFAARTISAAALLGLMLGAASAAGKPPPAAPVPPEVLALFNPAVPDNPAKVALAREFIQLYHPRIDMQHVVAMIDKGMPRAIEAAKARDPKVDVKKYEADTRAKMLAGAEKSLDRQSHVVSRHFSEQELKDLIAFFKSPLGHKLAEETTNIQHDMLMMNRVDRLNKMKAKQQTVDPPAKTPAKPQPHK